jgi:hypothetical protein
MKLPRWLLGSLLTVSVLAVPSALGACVWWWVTWPQRTMNEFVRAIATDNKAYWRELSSPEMKYFLDTSKRRPELADGDLEPVSRNLTEILNGQQEFQTGFARFVVNRGRVVDFRVADGAGNWFSVLALALWATEPTDRDYTSSEPDRPNTSGLEWE